MGKMIEFYGPPGAGKTTLAEECIGYLKEKKAPVLDLKEVQYQGYKRWLSEDEGRPVQAGTLDFITQAVPRDWGERTFDLTLFPGKHKYKKDMINHFSLQNPGLINDLIKKINTLYGHEEGKKVMGWFQDAFFRYQIVEEYVDEEIVVLDEGFCQQVLAAYSLIRTGTSRPDPEDDIIELIGHLPSRIDHAFFVSAEPETCLKRQEEREEVIDGFLEKKDEGIRKKDLEDRLKNSQIIHDALLKNGVVSSKIDADKSLEGSKDDLRHEMDEMMLELD